LGRAQEIILLLKKAINKGELPAFKIYVDGMVKDICRVYQLNPNYLHHYQAKKIWRGQELFYDDQVIAVTGRQEQREAIVACPEPCCIIASSGMLTGGPSQWYAQKLAGDPGNYIALTGYQDEESPGKQLLELADRPNGLKRQLKLGDLSLNVKCGIGTYGLSAHADKTEIISLIQSLHARHVFLVHGNPTTTATLARAVQTEYPGRVYAPTNGESFEPKIALPRKQLTKQQLPTLNRQTAPQETDLAELWRFISEQRGAAAGFTAEELLYTWSGRNDTFATACLPFVKLLNSSRYFESETRRPFIFHTVPPDTLSATENDRFMEVNHMLALVDERFPPGTGLYKKGARFEAKIVLLYFNFPLVAQQNCQAEFAAFTAETGWKIQVNSECNISAAQNLILQLLADDDVVLQKFSYFPVENRFKIRLNREISNPDQLQTKFRELTGMQLIPEFSGHETALPPTPVKATSDQVEQNQALAAITAAFAAQEAKLYKKSLKLINGQPGIELSFISPQIGERYRKLINQLESQLHWPIRINPTPNQMEILNTGHRLLTQNQIILKKNLSYLPKEMKVVATVQATKSEWLDGIAAEFQRLTGLEITFINQ
jgi:hypothetical protein